MKYIAVAMYVPPAPSMGRVKEIPMMSKNNFY